MSRISPWDRAEGARDRHHPLPWTSGLLLCALLLGAAPAWAAEYHGLRKMSKLNGPFLQAELHLSVFSDSAERAILASTFGYGLKGGYRWKGWGVFAQVEHNLWVGTELDAQVTNGAVNIGFGVELTYARGFVRSAIALGPSILAFDTALDKRGTTGLFLDVRPLGLRFTVHKYVVIGFDPLTFTMLAPVLRGIPLLAVQYRTAFYVEATW